ncbi:hypothetical protein [Actinomadura sp. WMMB 499]|uniref:hypothetical protein n=1 Tax=Actinomadura sp. WMMB 499 TaxID=1219491 RepID=UPI001247AC1C|nr:hypothetical protein [Actinomadura sp. WMMB 499]QFG23883.1 hypothetical protein F7P10_24955 [Actinomadura sp. WMMB 499]
MTGALVAAAMVAAGVVSGTAAAAQPQQQTQQTRDCRTYASTTVCGDLQLNEKQRACVTSSVQLGMTERRAEVECRATG